MKRRKVYGPDRDPVSRHVGEPLLDRALRGLLKPGELQLLSALVHGLHADQIARMHGLTSCLVEGAVAEILHRIRESPHGLELLEDLRSRGGPRFSALLWEGRSQVPVVHRCARETCGKRFEQATVGRARRFCSNACRQAAYRARRAQPRPVSLETRSAQPSDAPRGFRQRQTVPDLPAPRRAEGGWRQYLESSVAGIERPPADLIDLSAKGGDATIPSWIGASESAARVSLFLVDGAHRVSPMNSFLLLARLRDLRRGPRAPQFVLPSDVTVPSPLHTLIPAPTGRIVPHDVVPFPETAARFGTILAAGPGTGPARNRRDARGDSSRRGQHSPYRSSQRRRRSRG